jgi:hypothetical protein
MGPTLKPICFRALVSGVVPLGLSITGEETILSSTLIIAGPKSLS